MQTRAEVFDEIFLVFLALGTIIGIIVIAYTVYNAYKYRDDGDRASDDDLPTLGELPTGGKGGKKLFVSFGLSAIVVLSLIVYAYGLLLYVEAGPEGENPGEDAIEIDVEGNGFSWFFEYENGAQTVNDMYVPADTTVWINVTGGDVWHTFGISDLRVKADAIPGEYDQTWFVADEPGEEHLIECFELCGPFHTDMEGTLHVMEQDEFDDWLAEQVEDDEDDEADEDEDENDDGGDD